MRLGDHLEKEFTKFSSNPDDLEELDLSNIGHINSLRRCDKEFIEKFEGISSLCMIQVNLKSLKNWPKLNSVYLLNLNGNKLKTGLKEVVDNMPHISELELEYNRFEDINEFHVLKGLTNLVSITLQGNPITKLPSYRQELFNLLPHVKMIDNYDSNEHDYMQDLIDRESDDIRINENMMKVADEVYREDLRNECCVLADMGDSIFCV